MKPILRLACLTLCLLLAGKAMATGTPQGEPAKLKKLRQEIAQLQAQETHELQRKHAIQAELAALEKKIGTTSRQLQTLAARAHNLSVREKTLQGKSVAVKATANSARRQLSSALRAAFMLGREPRLKLALNGDDPATIARLLGYYGYYSRARAAHLLTLTATIKHYQTLQDELAATANDLQQTASDQRTALAELEKTRHSRQSLISRINHDIADKRTRAKQLEHDAARLEKLVNSVNRDLADVPSKLLDRVDFAKLRGRLPWPVTGHILNRFGDARAEGDLTWEAIRIAAPAGTDIHAIAYGRVAYAGWLPYYGLVLIVDHGAGYLTVYGHNQNVYKQVGDWVQAGEIVATVGTSGGQNRPLLYFQIRHHGKALDPARWCAKNPSAH
ncbi:MAG: peptidoglycan DD-metalloendopeptidase family protein [Gammaproteobacteria bacterium]